ncbi:hypothetical protein SNEBB_003489 [Seison nebaliae]|nr:hypothetical protein SNEBB_003489 [Seison nebaliae]
MDVYCWGSNSDYQLGLGGVEEMKIKQPTLNDFLANIMNVHSIILKSICCGSKHSMFLFDDGSVYTCGSNEYGQLGRDGPSSKPFIVSGFIEPFLKEKNGKPPFIKQIAASKYGSFALTYNGCIFQWGSLDTYRSGENHHQQIPTLLCGHSQWNENNAQTTTTTSNDKEKNGMMTKDIMISISHLSAGDAHLICLSDNGKLYGMGSNSHGQLGTGDTKNREICTPIESLSLLPIEMIACGARHSMILTTSGKVFAFGSNQHGQLGIGNCEDKIWPIKVKSLEKEIIIKIECGATHSMALNRNGELFTFGYGADGILGHGNTHSSQLPQMIKNKYEIVDCVGGNLHSAFVAKRKNDIELYVVGSNENGQLGLGSDHTNPTRKEEKHPKVLFSNRREEFMRSESVIGFRQEKRLRSSKPGSFIWRIFSAFHQSFLVMTKQYSLYNAIDELKVYVNLIDEKLIKKFVKSKEIDNFALIFSSVECINNSFLEKRIDRKPITKLNHGIDLQLAERLTFLLVDCDNDKLNELSAWLTKACNNISSSPPDLEALRIFLILPLFPVMSDGSRANILHQSFATTFSQLNENALRIIRYWYGMLEPIYYTKIISQFKNAIVYMLNARKPPARYPQSVVQKTLVKCLSLLKIIYEINQETKLVSYDTFYISELKDLINVPEDYGNWLNSIKMNENIFSFCQFSFVFDAAHKSLIIQGDAHIQMHNMIGQAIIRSPNYIEAEQAFLILYVSRENIVQDTITQLAKHPAENLKKPLHVAFRGEEAFDAGGVRKEFFLLLMQDLVDPKYGMFHCLEKNHCLWFIDVTFETSAMFELIGTTCGLAIYNSMIIHLPFPLALYKKLLKKSIILKDIKDLSTTLYSSFNHILNYDNKNDDFVDVLNLTYEVVRERFGAIETISLIDGKGSTTNSQRDVKYEDRQEYIDLYIDYLFNKSVKENYEAFERGFKRVCSADHILNLFQPNELMSLVVGNENFDWKLFEKCCEYDGGYTEQSTTIIHFWNVFRSLTLAEKKNFLLFLTGSDRLPIYGMKNYKIKIMKTGTSDDHLPVAHTCVNQLDLPDYETEEKLKNKLLTAISYHQGFALV